MGATGTYVPRTSGKVEYEPITGTLQKWEAGIRRNQVQEDREHGALFDRNGEPIIGYRGTRHSVAVDRRVLDNEGASFTHYHPDRSFGGTLSMQDLKVFASSKLGSLRAVSNQGQLYSITAGQNVDRQGLAKWVRANQKLAQQNFRRSYDSAIKAATTPLKSGPHKGQVKLVNRRTGQVVYRDPMTPQQAQSYARQYSVGMFDRMYSKQLSKFGVTYTSTKGGKGRTR